MPEGHHSSIRGGSADSDNSALVSLSFLAVSRRLLSNAFVILYSRADYHFNGSSLWLHGRKAAKPLATRRHGISAAGNPLYPIRFGIEPRLQLSATYRHNFSFIDRPGPGCRSNYETTTGR